MPHAAASSESSLHQEPLCQPFQRLCLRRTHRLRYRYQPVTAAFRTQICYTPPMKKTLYVLDAYGLIYRSYFAFINKPLTNKEGKNVSALFGFFRNLHAFFSQYNPECFVAAFDSPTPTFRHEMYDEYKATRQKTPEDLHAQIPVIEEILATLGVPLVRQDGFEADDIIASFAARCRD